MAESVDRTSASVDDAVDRVIRSFTDAEIALRELVASAESFKASSGTMESGRDELAAGRAALASTTDGLALLMASVASSATELQEAARALRAVDQARIWAGFEATSAALAVHGEAANESAAQVHARLVAVSDQVASAREDLDASIERVGTATKGEIGTAVSTLGAQLRFAIETSTATLSDRIDSSESASASAIATAQAELQADQGDMAAQLKVNLSRVERRATQVLVTAVVAAVFALAGVIIALL